MLSIGTIVFVFLLSFYFAGCFDGDISLYGNPFSFEGVLFTWFDARKSSYCLQIPNFPSRSITIWVIGFPSSQSNCLYLTY